MRSPEQVKAQMARDLERVTAERDALSGLLRGMARRCRREAQVGEKVAQMADRQVAELAGERDRARAELAEAQATICTLTARVGDAVDRRKRAQAEVAQDRRATGSLAAAYRRGWRDAWHEAAGETGADAPIIVPADLAVPDRAALSG